MFSDKKTSSAQDALQDLQAPEYTAVARMQQELVAASLIDQMADRPFAHVSRSFGNEAEVLNPEHTRETHVISLGSGGDILRPMHDFPLAAHYHLVDIMSGWCDGPQSIIEEVEQRLTSLAADATVERIRPGFTALVEKKALEDGALLQRQLQEVTDYDAQPLELRVRWTSPALGLQERHVSIHPVDYDRTKGHRLQSVVATIPETASIGGVLVSGAALPNPEVSRDFIEALAPGTTIIAEVYYNLDDRIPLFGTGEHLNAFTSPCDVTQAPRDALTDKLLAGDGRGVDTLVLYKRAL